MKTIEKLFGASVAVISLTTLITTVTGFIGLGLPRWALWAIGVVNMLSLPLMIYSTVKDLRAKAQTAARSSKKAAVKAHPAAEATTSEAEEAVKKVRPKPHPQALAAKKAASGNKPKKAKKKKR